MPLHRRSRQATILSQPVDGNRVGHSMHRFANVGAGLGSSLKKGTLKKRAHQKGNGHGGRAVGATV